MPGLVQNYGYSLYTAGFIGSGDRRKKKNFLGDVQTKDICAAYFKGIPFIIISDLVFPCIRLHSRRRYRDGCGRESMFGRCIT